jgi:hypothetical protein
MTSYDEVVVKKGGRCSICHKVFKPMERREVFPYIGMAWHTRCVTQRMIVEEREEKNRSK